MIKPLQKSAAVVVLLLISLSGVFSQSVGIGTNTPHSSAALEVNSTTKGTLISTMTTAQRNAIADPATGLLVYDIDKKTIYMYDGRSWLPFLVSTTNKNPPTLITATLTADDFFGYKVAIDGNYAIIGAYGRTVSGITDAGVAYIYYRNNGVWELQEILTADDREAGDNFGISVAISGDYAVIGARNDDIGADTDQGSVYIFSRTGSDWTQQQKLTAADGVDFDYFGTSVDISDNGTKMIVGAYGDDIGVNTNQGSAYVYTRSGNVWSLQAKLTASDGSTGDSFGYSVSINGNFAAIGAYLDDEGVNTDQGSVYIFYEFTNAGGWASGQAHNQKILAGDGEANDFYGVSVSLSGIHLLVGASGDDVGSNASQGSAWAYIRLPLAPFSYGLSQQLTAPDGAANDNFGISVAASNSTFAIGSYRSEGPANSLNNGSVYQYFVNGSFRDFRRKIEDDDGQTNGYFGFSVAVSGFEIVMGAYNKNNGAGQAGFINVQ